MKIRFTHAEFVAYIMRKAGMKIPPHEKIVTPKELFKSKHIEWKESK